MCTSKFYSLAQWRIPDFPEGGHQPQSGGANPLFSNFIPVNYMKMKEIGPGGAHVPGTPS